MITDFGRIDIMQWLEGVSFRALRRRAVYRDLADVGRVWFAGLDDLIAMKSAAGRPQDLLDIEAEEAPGLSTRRRFMSCIACAESSQFRTSASFDRSVHRIAGVARVEPGAEPRLGEPAP